MLSFIQELMNQRFQKKYYALMKKIGGNRAIQENIGVNDNKYHLKLPVEVLIDRRTVFPLLMPAIVYDEKGNGTYCRMVTTLNIQTTKLPKRFYEFSRRIK